MLVYRVEHHKSKVGPYCHHQGDQPKLICEMHEKHLDNNHPAWIWDGICVDGPEWKAGFDCLANLEDWFGEYLPKLLKMGFRIVKIEAEEIIYGKSGRQLAFRS